MSKKLPIIRNNTPEREAEAQRQLASDPDTLALDLDRPPLRVGRPRGSDKTRITAMLDNDVLAALKAPEAKGWQTRMNATLREALGL